MKAVLGMGVVQPVKKIPNPDDIDRDLEMACHNNLSAYM